MHARLYVVVTPSLCRHPVADTVAAAVEGGAGAVQLRWKEAADAEFVALARDLGALCHGLGVPFLINDRDGLYEACGADGIHLGEDDLPPEEFRRRFGDAPLVGLSTHDRFEVAAAAGRGASYVGLGPVFATETKRLSRPPGGPALVRAVEGATALPLYPIGGITAANAASLVEAGARRLAVSSAVCAADDPRDAAAALARLLA